MMFIAAPVAINLIIFFIIESKQVGHGWFSFRKSMLTVINYLLFQAARMCFKGICYVVFQGTKEKMTSFSLNFSDSFKDGCNICLSPGTCDLPQFPWLLGSVISLARTFTTIRCTPSGIMGLYGTSRLKEFLTQTLSTFGRCPP